MKTIASIVLVFFTAIIASSCDPAIKEQELKGTWKTDDGAAILLHENGTYTASQINYFYFSGDNAFKDRKIDLSGKWIIRKTGNQETQTVELRSNQTYKDFGIAKTYEDRDGLQQSYKINCNLEITGSGPLNTSKPYYLVKDIGDPDDSNQYTFKKQ